MTRVFVLCLVLFPVIFVGMLVATGTLQDYLLPEVQSQFSERFGGGDQDEEPEEGRVVLDVVDSLLVAEIEVREAAVEAATDLLEVIQGRIEMERQELALLAIEIQGLVEELQAMQQSLEVTRSKERAAFAKLFGEIDPERAAAILQQITVGNAEFLVKTMKSRQAAEVLGLLPAALSAELAERILNPTDGTNQEG